MNTTEKILRSVYYFTTQIVPSGVTVVDGQNYGIRVDDPTYQLSSVAIALGDISNADLELGSFGTEYPIYFYINALSRLQRNALKDIVRSGIYNQTIPIYSDFIQFVPSGGAVIEQYAGLGTYFSSRDIPNFSSDKERYFWNSVVTVTLDVFGL